MTVLLVSGLLAAGCGSSSPKSSSNSSSSASTTEASSASKDKVCRTIGDLANTGTALPRADLAGRKAGVAKVTSSLKTLLPTSPEELKKPLYVIGVYYGALGKATAMATSVSDYDAKAKTVKADDQKKAASTVAGWYQKNCS